MGEGGEWRVCEFKNVDMVEGTLMASVTPKWMRCEVRRIRLFSLRLVALRLMRADCVLRSHCCPFTRFFVYPLASSC